MNSQLNQSLSGQVDSIIEFDPWYLRPPQEAYQIRHSDHYIKHNEKKKGQRKVYQKVEYDEYELQQIEILRADMIANSIQTPPDWRISDYLKMCYCGRFDKKKNLKAAREHIEWRNNKQVHTLDAKSRALLENGMIYLLGRDNQFRPIIYLDCHKINLKRDGEESILKAMCVFLDMIKKYMFLDYYIENWIMVIDTGGLGLNSLPVDGLKLMIGSMSINYCATMDKMYLLNPSFILNTSWNIIKGFIDPESVEKIQFLKQKEYKEMQKKIPEKYLQEKYSGKHPNLKEFWPPLSVFYSEENQKQIKKIASLKGNTDNETDGDNRTVQSEKKKSKTKSVSSPKSPKEDRRIGSDFMKGLSTKETLQSRKEQTQINILNDGIKPKIFVTIADDKIDTQYAVAGYDEELEKQLREQVEAQKAQKQAESAQQAVKEDVHITDNGTEKKQNLKSLNSGSTYNINVSTNSYNQETIRNSLAHNISSTDHSEGTTFNNKISSKMVVSQGVPDIEDFKNDETLQDTEKLLAKEETFPIDNLNSLDDIQKENKINVLLEGDNPNNTKCCQSCSIF